MTHKRHMGCLLACALLLAAGRNAVQARTPENRILRDVRSYIEERVEADSLDIRIVLEGWDSGMTLPEPGGIRIAWTRGSDHLRGRVFLPVEWMDRSGEWKTAYASADIRIFRKVCVSERLFNRHDPFHTDGIRMEMREVSGLSREAYESVQDLLAMRARRLIPAGRIITQDMAEACPVVRRGERVQIRVISGNLTVTLSGVAREDGWMGDRIRVRNKDQRREITACVTGENRVSITL